MLLGVRPFLLQNFDFDEISVKIFINVDIFKKKCPWDSEGYCATRQKMSKTKLVVDGLKKSCYNKIGSKMLVGASKSVSIWNNKNLTEGGIRRRITIKVLKKCQMICYFMAS